MDNNRKTELKTGYHNNLTNGNESETFKADIHNIIALIVVE